jgi:hypothetical protein
MILTSDLFQNVKELEDCAKLDSKHIVADEPPLRRGKNNQGPHIALIHKALRRIMPSPSFGLEEATETYGPKTAEVVRQFKAAQTPPILNQALGQTVPDNIVGKRTIVALDKQAARKKQPPAKQAKAVDIVVRYIGAAAKARLTDQEIVSDTLITTYKGQHAADRKLTRIGARTTSPRQEEFLAADLLSILEAIKGKAIGKICIFGSSNGGNNAFVLAQRVLTAGLPLAYLGVADPVFFAKDTTDRPTKNGDPPDVVPTFKNFNGIALKDLRADLKENFFQVEGNHTRRETRGLFLTFNFTSDDTMKGEIHGELDGFPPGTKISVPGEKNDFDRHDKLGDLANPKMEASVAGILNQIPSAKAAP